MFFGTNDGSENSARGRLKDGAVKVVSLCCHGQSGQEQRHTPGTIMVSGYGLSHEKGQRGTGGLSSEVSVGRYSSE